MAESPIQKDTMRGAGLYGYREESHKTACPNSNNPAGHNPNCPCVGSPAERWQRVLNSQRTPYAEPDYPESPHAAL